MYVESVGNSSGILHRGDGQRNGNTRQKRNKTVVGCTEGTLVVSIFRYSFVYAV